MWVLMNMSPENSGWQAALNKANEIDLFAVETKRKIFVVADELCELIMKESSSGTNISVTVSEKEFSICVDGVLVIKFLLVWFEGLLPMSVLCGEQELGDSTVRAREVNNLIDGKGSMLIREIEAIQQWVTSVSERMEEDPETVRRVKIGLIMLKVCMRRLKGLKDSD